jgi:hypothetical protein
MTFQWFIQPPSRVLHNIAIAQPSLTWSHFFRGLFQPREVPWAPDLCLGHVCCPSRGGILFYVRRIALSRRGAYTHTSSWASHSLKSSFIHDASRCADEIVKSDGYTRQYKRCILVIRIFTHLLAATWNIDSELVACSDFRCWPIPTVHHITFI